MLELLEACDGTAGGVRELREALARHVEAVLASRGHADRQVVARAEGDVSADTAAAIHVDLQGMAEVRAVGRTWQGGRFETPSVDELVARARRAREDAGRPAVRVRLAAIAGPGPGTDIGALQATAAAGSLFQVASQFNCLEAPSPRVVRVADYLSDPTQGPRASVSAFPGTLVRHYAAPGPRGQRFVQSSAGPQLDLLADVCAPGVARVSCGYLRPGDVRDAAAFADALEERWGQVRVGLHDGVEVALGYDWDGSVEGERRIAQAFTSTLACGLYGRVDPADAAFARIVRHLQRAAYTGTLAGAAALGVRRVGLTLIGGGVFGNPQDAILDAILQAFGQLNDLARNDILVVVNARGLEGPAAAALADAVRDRDGLWVTFSKDGTTSIDR